MARVNTPKQYRCSICSEFGHNARTCPKKATTISATQMMKEIRSQKRAKKAAIKAAKAAPTVEVAPVEEVEVMPTSEVLEVSPTDVPFEEWDREGDDETEPTDEELMVLEEEEEQDEDDSLAAFATHDPELAALLSDMGI